MKKTYCDRCGEECDGNQTVQRYTVFDVNHSVDFCDRCYKELVRWLTKRVPLKEDTEN